MLSTRDLLSKSLFALGIEMAILIKAQLVMLCYHPNHLNNEHDRSEIIHEAKAIAMKR